MRNIFLALLAFIISIHAGAQATGFSWTEKTSGGYSYRTVNNDPSGTRFYKLPNGLTVILSVNKSEPRIQTLIVTKAGSKTDPSTNTGLAHYLEHMLFKGTDKFGTKDWAKEEPLLKEIDRLYEVYNKTTDPAERTRIYAKIDSVSYLASGYAIANEYDKMCSSMGAKGTNASTSFDRTDYINNIPANMLDKWLELEGERYRKPVLRLFHTELEAVYEEKNNGLDDDEEKVFETVFASLFLKHNYGLQTTIGTIEHLKNPSLEEIRKYFYANYVPNNMAVILAGDFDPDAAIAKVEKTFSFMQPKPVAPYTFKPEEPITKPVIREVFGQTTAKVNIAYRMPGASTDDAMMLSLVSNMLNNGKAGLIDLNLVKKQQLLESFAFNWNLKDYSVLWLGATPREGQSLEVARDLLLGEIDKLRKGDFDESLITSIINNNKRQKLETFETNMGRAFTLEEFFYNEVDWTRYFNDDAFYAKVTKEDVMAFANKYLPANGYVCVFKRQGEDPNVLKVDKPKITPVQVNRDSQSDFLKQFLAKPTAPLQPVFLDYNKDIARSAIGKNAILAVQNKDNSLFSLYYVFEMGKNNDQKLPLAVKYLEFLGTDKYSSEAISKELYRLACNFGVSSNEEQTYVYLTGLQENFQEALELFEHLLANCKPEEAALKNMIEDEIKSRENNKLEISYISGSAMNAYGKYEGKNPFNDVLSSEQLQALKGSDLTDVLHKLTGYAHNILYYGPLPVSEASSIIAKHHTDGQAPLPPPPARSYKFRTVTDNTVYFTQYDQMVKAQINWTRNVMTFNAGVFPKVRLFNQYFGGDMSSIVFQEIRESKALAYSSYSVFSAPGRKEDPYSLYAYIGTQADKILQAIPAMNQLLTELPFSEKSFSQAQQAIRNNIAASRISKSQILFDYLTAQRRGIDLDLRRPVYEEVEKLNFEDIRRFHEEHISKRPFVITVLGDKSKIDLAALGKFGAVKEVPMEELFGY